MSVVSRRPTVLIHIPSLQNTLLDTFPEDAFDAREQAEVIGLHIAGL
jgi:hypothetical protein